MTNLNGVISYYMLRIKYLGVIINDKLKWCELISYVKNKYLGVIINHKLKWCELISYVKNKVFWCNNKSQT